MQILKVIDNSLILYYKFATFITIENSVT